MNQIQNASQKKQILLSLSEWQEDCAVCRELMGNNKSMLAIVEHENINININTGKTLISFVGFFWWNQFPGLFHAIDL